MIEFIKTQSFYLLFFQPVFTLFIDNSNLLCTAFCKAVYDGHWAFTAMAVCGGKDGVITGYFPPCGVCRQVMAEFCKDDFTVYLAGPGGTWQTYSFAQLLPYSFNLETE